MYHPIRIISVTTLNISNPKDAAGVGGGVSKGAVESLLELPVFHFFCLSARCLTLTRAGDECNLWQPMELTDSWESELPAVKVSIFKAHQLQWEGSATAHMPALTARQEKTFSYACSHKQIHTLALVNPFFFFFCKETSEPKGVIAVFLPAIALESYQLFA